MAVASAVSYRYTVLGLLLLTFATGLVNAIIIVGATLSRFVVACHRAGGSHSVAAGWAVFRYGRSA